MCNSDFSKAKIGMGVWSVSLGYCQITSTNEKGPYPIMAENIEKSETFTLDGKAYKSDAGPSLFHKRPDCFKTKIKKETTLEGYFSPETEMFCTTNYNSNMYRAQANITYEIEE